MKEYVPAASAAWVLRIWLLLLSLPPAIILGAITAFFPIVGMIILIIMLLFICALMIFFIPMWLKSIRLLIYKDNVEVFKGIIFKNRYIMPKTRLIYISRVRSPLASLFGLCSIKLNAARNHLIIPLIKADEADELINIL